MAGVDAPSLREIVAKEVTPRSFYDRGTALRFTDLARGTSLGGHPRELAGRSVLLATESQLTSALALIELEGVARRIVILPPDADPAHLPAIIAIADIDAVLTDEGAPTHAAFDRLTRVVCRAVIEPLVDDLPPRSHTDWIMMTSGTTGVPKMVIHDLATLTTALRVPSPADGADVWGTFYDIRRYGGLQIYLRAVCGRASFVLSSAGEPVSDHLARLGAHGVTHLSGTPSQWRRALMMMPANEMIAPGYVRLSGEIADQAVLDSLRAAFPSATIGHGYASTEAGVVFDVNDGLAGFPTEYIGTVRNGVAMKILDGTLRIRSSGAAKGYVGGGPLFDAAGFVDSGDIIERHGERFYFAGRKGGVINIGGLKVHPEEIEAVINRHPCVRMSLVRGRQNPVTGSIVVADVVLKGEGQAPDKSPQQIALKDDILKLCRETLPRHKVPAAISFVPALKVAATGKLVRRQ
ncbi:MAG TPA: class I adenylate-forming enzyme family protein [Xanthobacteraceae bacterium]|nr:class I adenylate-forming enzyme family protein [Xanthobacteraceae bacterium]